MVEKNDFKTDFEYFRDVLCASLDINREDLARVDKKKVIQNSFENSKCVMPCPCPYPDKLGIYILKESMFNNVLSIKRKHIRWDGYRFIVDNFYDRKGLFQPAKYMPRDLFSQCDKKRIELDLEIWDHIENGVDEYRNVDLEDKYKKKKEPSILFDPYFLGGRRDNLW